MTGSESPESKRRGRFLRYAPLIFWIGLIFFFSTMQGSMSNTSIFIRPLLKFLFPAASEDLIAIYHGYVRKSAHFTEYAILAFWASRAFWSSSGSYLRRNWFAFAFSLVLLIASLDEFNQGFNPQRTSSFSDVLLDVSGGVCMILILLAVRSKCKK